MSDNLFGPRDPDETSELEQFELVDDPPTWAYVVVLVAAFLIFAPFIIAAWRWAL